MDVSIYNIRVVGLLIFTYYGVHTSCNSDHELDLDNDARPHTCIYTFHHIYV